MQKTVISIVLSSILAVTGCTTTDPTTGQAQSNNTRTGALIGAVGGAVAGSLIRDDRRGVLVGAAVGGAAGAAIGNQKDKRDAELRAAVANTGVQVEVHEDYTNLVMPGNVTFATNSYDIQSSFYQTLDSVANIVAQYPEVKLTITGHTDSTGSYATNKTLSERRANSVRDYLMTRSIAPARINTEGVADRYPLASNDTPQGRETNRRVEIRLEQPQS